MDHEPAILNLDSPSDYMLKHHADNFVQLVVDQRPLVAAYDLLVHKGRNIENLGDHQFNYRVNFAELQRMYMRKLQLKLMRHAVAMKSGEGEDKGWEDNLQKYIRAVQDYDFMTRAIKQPGDPFIATGERSVDNILIDCVIQSKNLNVGDFKKVEAIPTGPWSKEPAPIGGTRNESMRKLWRANYLERLIYGALVGGIFLIAPMWIMVLYLDLKTDLIVTTVSVAVFGIFAAYFVPDLKDVLAGTAAYAAVLMVFVGALAQGSP